MFARALSVLTLVASLSACQKPQPPTIVPKEARVTAVGVTGIDLVVVVEATNPNGFTVTAQSFTGKARLAGKYDLGTVTVQKAVVLPSKAKTTIEVPMTMPWADVQTLGTLLASPQPIPYAIDGTAKIGGENLNVDVPFAVTGTITRDQIGAAAMKGFPAIPGWTAPP